MKLSTIFQQLVHGEFHELSFGDGQGSIGPNEYDRMTNMVNLGVAALYKRFKIKEGRLWLKLEEGLYQYVLHSDHALSTKTNKPKYIIDSKEVPFTNDINKIESVQTQEGFALPFNDANHPRFIQTLKQNLLEFPVMFVDEQKKMPEVMRGTMLKVSYRAGHGAAICCPAYYDPEMIDVPLPEMYLEALLYFVASRVYNPIGFNADFHHGTNYAAKYEQECQRLELMGLQLDKTSENDRFTRNGWI